MYINPYRHNETQFLYVHYLIHTKMVWTQMIRTEELTAMQVRFTNCELFHVYLHLFWGYIFKLPLLSSLTFE
jgi:hypothetical protein